MKAHWLLMSCDRKSLSAARSKRSKTYTVRCRYPLRSRGGGGMRLRGRDDSRPCGLRVSNRQSGRGGCCAGYQIY